MGIFKHLLPLLAFVVGSTVWAEEVKTTLLNKVTLVIDGQITTLSDIKSIKESYPTRQRISPILYREATPTNEGVVDSLINTQIIRKHLSDAGYIISDAHVEDEINMTQKNLNITRQQLLGFLEQNGLTFQAYFDIMRASIEMNMFNAKTVAPRINISDDMVKNSYVEKHKDDSTLAFEYSLVDYAFPSSSLTPEELKEIPKQLQRYRSNNIMSETLQKMTTNSFSALKESGLNPALYKTLREGKEEDFTSPVTLEGVTHFFYIVKKSLVESEKYKLAKDQLKFELFEVEATKLTKTWINKERLKHSIFQDLST